MITLRRASAHRNLLDLLEALLHTKMLQNLVFYVMQYFGIVGETHGVH